MSPLPDDQTTCVYLKGTTFHEQPKSWQNFVLTHVPAHVFQIEDARPYLNEGLAPYCATFTDKEVQFACSEQMWQWILAYG